MTTKDFEALRNWLFEYSEDQVKYFLMRHPNYMINCNGCNCIQHTYSQFYKNFIEGHY